MASVEPTEVTAKLRKCGSAKLKGTIKALRITIFILLAAIAAVCQPTSMAAKPADPCAKATTDMERTSCWAGLTQKAEAQLNDVYSRIQKSLRAQIAAEPVALLKTQKQNMLDNLRTVQLAWSRYRKAQCDADAAEYAGGIVEPQVRAGCMKEMAEQRSADLEKHFARFLKP